MCEFCKNSIVYGDTLDCKLLGRTPSYEEFKKCKNFIMHDELIEIFQEGLELKGEK